MCKSLFHFLLFNSVLALFISQINTCYSQEFYEEIIYPDSVNIISMLPLNYDTVFIGGGTQYATGGVYRSFDSGNNWEFMGLDGHSIYCLVQGNGDTIYAGSIGVYRSCNLGESWELILPLPQNAVSICELSSGGLFVGYWGGIMRSLDHGVTWDTSLVLNMNSVINVILPVSENEIYAGGTAYTSGDAGLFKSEDLGESWNNIGLEGYNIQDLGYNSNNELLVGSYYSGLLKTSDEGLTWDTVLPDKDVVSIIIHFDEINLGCANQSFPNGGIYYSPDNGLSWENQTYNITNNRIKKIYITQDQYLYSLSRYESISLGPPLNRSINPVSINENKSSKYHIVNIFPNPTSDYINVVLPESLKNNGKLNFSIYDQFGHLVRNNSMIFPIDYNTIKTDITNLAPGIYYLRIIVGSEKCFGKFIVL